MKVLKGIGVFVSAILTYLVVIIFTPVLNRPKQVMERKAMTSRLPHNRETFITSVNGTVIEGWFYKTNKTEKAPCVILSHGFAGTKDGIMEDYAQRFVDAGFHAITYDFRYFGASGGKPRQLYCGDYQYIDLKTIVEYAKTRSEIHSDKLFLWGTSAGAHLGVLVAQVVTDIAGVIGQCGAYDHDVDGKFQVKQMGIGHFLNLFMHAQRDKGRSRFHLSPHMITAYGKPGTTAMFSLPGTFEHVEAILGDSETFKNEIAARSLLMPHSLKPEENANRIQCKVLLQKCSNDELVSPDTDKKLKERLGDKALSINYPINHFQIYEGEHFDRSVTDQISFINSQLKENKS